MQESDIKIIIDNFLNSHSVLRGYNNNETRVRSYDWDTAFEELNSPIHHDIISCRFCKSKQIFFTTKQTRSADEAATIFYECKSKQCGKTWRINN